jgi:hypothetical protein
MYSLRSSAGVGSARRSHLLLSTPSCDTEADRPFEQGDDIHTCTHACRSVDRSVMSSDFLLAFFTVFASSFLHLQALDCLELNGPKGSPPKGSLKDDSSAGAGPSTPPAQRGISPAFMNTSPGDSVATRHYSGTASAASSSSSSGGPSSSGSSSGGHDILFTAGAEHWADALWRLFWECGNHGCVSP